MRIQIGPELLKVLREAKENIEEAQKEREVADAKLKLWQVVWQEAIEKAVESYKLELGNFQIDLEKGFFEVLESAQGDSDADAEGIRKSIVAETKNFAGKFLTAFLRRFSG